MVGWRQRAAASSGSVEDDSVPPCNITSGLASLMVYYWAWGMMSPQTVQKICQAVHRDLERLDGPDGAAVKDEIMTEIMMLAKIGSKGQWDNNTNRDIKSVLGVSAIKTSMFSMPLKLVRGAAGTMGTAVDRLMLLPHVLFSIMGNQFPRVFAKLICPSKERLADFWSNMAGSPQLQGAGSALSRQPSVVVHMFQPSSTYEQNLQTHTLIPFPQTFPQTFLQTFPQTFPCTNLPTYMCKPVSNLLSAI